MSKSIQRNGVVGRTREGHEGVRKARESVAKKAAPLLTEWVSVIKLLLFRAGKLQERRNLECDFEIQIHLRASRLWTAVTICVLIDRIINRII